MSRWIAFTVVLAAVVGSGVASGLQSGRWGAGGALQAAAARLDKLPLALGEGWDVQTRKLSQREVAVAELEGYVSRRYLHRRSGALVSVLLVCGRPGPICVHTPEICYVGAGFTASGPATMYTAPLTPSPQFRVQDFRKSDAAHPTMLRVCMSWGSQGEWFVPDNPRLAFAARPFLYKLYVVQELAREKDPLKGSPTTDLIKDLMPQIQKTLFSGS